MIFADPTRYLRGGKATGTIPKPLAPHRLVQAADMASDDPTFRVVLALTAIHALGAEETRLVRLDDVNLRRTHLLARDPPAPGPLHTPSDHRLPGSPPIHLASHRQPAPVGQ